MPPCRPAALPACLQDRLDSALDITTLFQAPGPQALALVRTCKAIAGGWQGHYLEMRERIEASGHHARWEFSKQLLFDKTNHAAEVGGDGAGRSPS
jgi:dynein heavy chain